MYSEYVPDHQAKSCSSLQLHLRRYPLKATFELHELLSSIQILRNPECLEDGNQLLETGKQFKIVKHADNFLH